MYFWGDQCNVSIQTAQNQMGNRLRTPKNTADPEVLKEEKEETVEIRSLVRDERTHKILGSALLFFGLFLFVAFSGLAKHLIA